MKHIICRFSVEQEEILLLVSNAWRLKGRKLLSGAKYLVREGELVVRNRNYNDTGQYTWAAKNIIGSSEASGNLTVRSKKKFFFSTINNRLNKALITG